MNEQGPSTDFNPHAYERPNQNWICGKSVEGKPCRIGPDSKGRCRATFECQPVLELKEGETKGRWRCTRTPEQGGPCHDGPQPDGTCSRAIPKCVPVRSLRAKRRVFTISVAAFTAAILLVGLLGPFREQFINPGELSSQHATMAFAKMANTNSQHGCGACHNAARPGDAGWLNAAFKANPGPFEFGALASVEPPEMGAIDRNCAHCHTAHSFHEPNVVREHSCSVCHREHQGAGLMPPPTDANCLSCHASSSVMQASIELGRSLLPDAFDFRPAQGRVLFKAPRPERGYTSLIHGFVTDHPEFQIFREKLQDGNTLKFNHALHLTSDTIQPLHGGRMQCVDCHKPDAAGVYYLKISYEESCKSCHSLQFDANNPGLQIPHGRTEHVRAFLRSLPEQYASFGARTKGISGRRELDQFVQTQMSNMRAQFGSGEELERRVFLSDARSGPVSKVGGLGDSGAARFPGCAYCHEVSVSEGSDVAVTDPVIPDRWLIRGSFNHGKHFKIDCAQCHNAVSSRDTADILLPAQASCIECHSPAGGVAHNCSTCHSYHTPRKQIVGH